MATATYLLILPSGFSTVFAIEINFSLMIAGIAIVSMVSVGLYNADIFLSYRLMMVKTIAAFGLAAPVICLTIFFFGESSGQEMGFWILWYLKVISVWCLCISVSHIIYIRLADRQTFKRRVLVIGTGRRADRIRQLARRTAVAFVPVAFVTCGVIEGDDPTGSFRLHEGTNFEKFGKFVRDLGVGEIVVAMDDRRGLPTEQLLRCKMSGVRVIEFLSFCERENGRVDLAALQPSWLVFSNGFRSGLVTRAVKRIFDIAFGGIALALTAPLLLLAALSIKLDSSGPVFYRQERVGAFGKKFVLMKLRSMYVEAEQDGQPRWAAKHDPRVTRVGFWLRKLRMDELPQLFNVLRGEMSFVGPRPERPFFVDQFTNQIALYGARHGVKPGITGWAQINYPYAASLEDARQKLEYDLYYVKNHTLFLDIAILIATVRVILFPTDAR